MPVKNGGQGMDHWTEEDVDFFLLAKNQFSVMPTHALDRIAAVDRASSFPEFPALLVGSIRAENDVLRGDTQSLQEAHPKLMGGPHIQNFRNPHAEMGTIFRWRRGGILLCEPCPQCSDRHFSSSRFPL